MNSLQFFQLTLENYRQFEGKTSFNLETTYEKNINVIEGQNGAGKSNLLNAITLCLYGEELHIDARSDSELKSDPYVTKSRLQGLESGESAEGHVEVVLGTDEPRYAFRRTFTTVRQGGGESDDPEYSNSLGDLRLKQRFGGSDWAPIADPENVRNEILPPHVYQYFLFDGEQLDEFFGEGYSRRVKNAVLDISHVELLNNAINHLREVRREFERESSKLGGDVSELQSRMEGAEDELQRLKEKREELETDITEAETKVEDINDRLSASADDTVRELQRRRSSLEIKLDEKDGQLLETKRELGGSLSRAGAVAYNLDALSESIKMIEAHVSEAGDGVPGVTEELIEAIISRGECICGQDISGGNPTHKHLKDLREEVSSSDTGVVDARPKMERALTQGESLLEKLLEDHQAVQDTREWIDEKETELSNISAQLEDKDTVDDDKAAELEDQRKRISERIRRMDREIGNLERQIDNQAKAAAERREEWQDAMEEQAQNEALVAKSIFVSESIEELESIKTDILDRVRKDTERRLQQYYNELIWKDEEYEVTLTEDYQVQLYDPDGRKQLGSLAAGERQVLALSFMAALSKISGFNAPVIIDTPLGRISSDPRKLIAQNLPSYLEDKQVTLLMTDVEYSEDVRAFIGSKVANEYHLNYRTGTTEVVRR